MECDVLRPGSQYDRLTTRGCSGRLRRARETHGDASSLSNPFPNGVVPTIHSPTGLANNLGNTLNTMLHSQRTATTYNFNSAWNMQFPHDVLVNVGYVGSRGLFLPLGAWI